MTHPRKRTAVDESDLMSSSKRVARPSTQENNGFMVPTAEDVFNGHQVLPAATAAAGSGLAMGAAMANHLAAPVSTYNPSLSVHQNPIYYEPNRVLYEAHLSRLSRSS